jgi:nucleotide-binding universal stress UspA family protein
MFSKILVPLDGSQLAERALAPAFSIAKQFASEVVLLRVSVPEMASVGLQAAAPYHYEPGHAGLRQAEQEADAYLEGIKIRWLGSGVRTNAETLWGTPPEMIVAAANELGVDLVVMSTHGRSGVERLIYGSVAEAVIRGVHMPVLLVPRKA